MLLPDQIYNARDSWHFGDFRYIFLPSISESQKKVLPSDRGALALCHMVNPALVIPLRSSKGCMGPQVATFRTKTFNFNQVINLNWLAKLN